MTGNDLNSNAALKELLESNGLTEDARFYRYTNPKFLTPTGEPGKHILTANPDPSESVSDVYQQGHLTAAVHVGPGLSFAQAAENQWKEDGRIAIEVCLKDVLDQGGLIYPVETVITEPTWYLTLPKGDVIVSEVG